MLHVVDGSHEDPEGQLAAVREVLREIGAGQRARDRRGQQGRRGRPDGARPPAAAPSRTASSSRPGPARASTSCWPPIERDLPRPQVEVRGPRPVRPRATWSSRAHRDRDRAVRGAHRRRHAAARAGRRAARRPSSSRTPSTAPARTDRGGWWPQRSSGRSAGAHDGQRDRVDVLAALAAAVAGVGGRAADGQRQMAEAVQDGDATRRAPARAGRHRHRASRWRTSSPRCCTRREHRPTRSSWRRRPSPCSASWSSATCRCSRTASSRCSAAGPTSRSSRAATTTCAGTASPRVRPTSAGADDGALFAPAPTTALGRGRCADPRVGRPDARPATGTSSCPRRPSAPGGRSSVTAHECLGAARARTADDCFAELARERARRADVVVTNHAMLAIDAFAGIPLLPDHDVVVVDEAHELVDRATGAVTDELTAADGRAGRAADPAVRRAGPPTTRWCSPARRWRRALAGCRARAGSTALARAAVRRAGRRARRRAPWRCPRPAGATGGDRDGVDAGPHAGAGRRRGAARDRRPDRRGGRARRRSGSTRSERRPPALLARTAVGGRRCCASSLFGTRDGRAHLRDARARRLVRPRRRGLGRSAGLDRRRRACTATWRAGAWTGLDVGSPFDYPRQGILYVARHLPPPGRDGLADALARRARRAGRGGGRAARSGCSPRSVPPSRPPRRCASGSTWPVLCQGDDATAELVRRFAGDPATCLFGTLSLWQGVDVPGLGVPPRRHRPDPVPAPGRPAGPGAAGRGRSRRLHDGQRRVGGAAARPGRPAG